MLGLSQVADVLELRTPLNNAPDEVVSAWQRLATQDLSDLGAYHQNTFLLRDAWTFLTDQIQARELKILRRRSGDPPETLDQIGDDLGLTRERVRQLEKRSLSRLREASVNQPAIVSFSRMFSATIGPASPTDEPSLGALRGRALKGVPREDHSLVLRVILDQAGPYDVESDWIFNPDRELEIKASLDELGSGASSLSVAEILLRRGIREELISRWMEERGSYRLVRDNWIRLVGTVLDKCEAILEVINEPVSVDEILSHLDRDYDARSVRGRLFADDRFVRTSRSEIALTRWELPEYSNVSALMIDAIESAGGAIQLELLAETLSTAYGVSPSSVRIYARTPQFVLDAASGSVRIRDPNEPYRITESPYEKAGTYRIEDQWVRRVEVDRHLLRGSGQAFPDGLAHALGLMPGGQCYFRTEAGESVVLTWPLASPSGASMGSLREVALRLGLEVGDQLTLKFGSGSRLDVEAVKKSELQGGTPLALVPKLMGIPVLPSNLDDAVAVLESAVGLSRDTPTRGSGRLDRLRTHLRSSKDNLVGDLLDRVAAETEDVSGSIEETLKLLGTD